MVTRRVPLPRKGWLTLVICYIVLGRVGNFVVVASVISKQQSVATQFFSTHSAWSLLLNMIRPYQHIQNWYFFRSNGQGKPTTSPPLVGGFNPSEKYARQIGSFPQIGIFWNHHLDLTKPAFWHPFSMAFVAPVSMVNFFQKLPSKWSKTYDDSDSLMFFVWESEIRIEVVRARVNQYTYMTAIKMIFFRQTTTKTLCMLLIHRLPWITCQQNISTLKSSSRHCFSPHLCSQHLCSQHLK